MELRDQNSGAVFVELALSSIVILTVLGLGWNMWAREELTQSVRASAISTFNDRAAPSFEAYKVDGNGAKVQYESGDFAAPVGPMLTNLGNLLLNHVVNGSDYSAITDGLWCAIELAYLDVSTIGANAGVVTGLTEPFSSNKVTVGAVPADQSALLAAVNQAKSSYANYWISNSLKLLGPITQVQLAPGAPVNEVYFHSGAFIAWGCEARSNFLWFNRFPLRVVDISVPLR